MRNFATLILLAVVLLLSAGAAFGSEVPQMVPIKNMADRMETAKKALDAYRQGLESWSGTFLVEMTVTKEAKAFYESERHQKSTQSSWARLIRVNVNKLGFTKIEKFIIEENGQETVIKSGDQTDRELGESFDLIRQTIFATVAGNRWDYYAGEYPGEIDSIERWVRHSNSGWTGYHLNRGIGYLPTKIEFGDYTATPADTTIFSDYRKTNGRWTAWKMVTTVLVPDKDVPNTITTVMVQKFSFVPKSAPTPAK